MNRSYKRKMFATAVVLFVMATPLFAAQAASSAQAAKPVPQPAKPATATAKPATGAQKPVPAAAAPAAPKAPTVRAATAPKAAPAASPAKAVPAVTTAKPAPAGASKAVPAVAAKAAPAPALPATSSALSPVQQKVQGNKELTRELQTRMPGADVVSAAAGFRDLPQFVAAAHASHNLAITFDTLKAKLLAGKRTSLRQAIQEVRPAASAAIEAQRAEYDAIGTIAATQQPAVAPAAASPAMDKDKDKAKVVRPAAKPKASTEQR